MEQYKIEAIKKVKRDIGIILVGLEPDTEAEWVIHDKLTAVNKTMRSIDFSSIAQMPMIPAEPEIECPTCHGSRQVKDGTDNDAVCPQCKGRGRVLESSLQGTLIETETETEPEKEKETNPDLEPPEDLPF